MIKKKRKHVDIGRKTVRAALTNGTLMVVGADHRLPWMRRLKDLIETTEADLGGVLNMSNVEQVLVRRASFLILQMELLESRCAKDQDGRATPRQLNEYQRCLSAVRRIYETLLGKDGGLKRRAHDITPVSRLELREMLDA